jgi:hypothetical protein
LLVQLWVICLLMLIWTFLAHVSSNYGGSTTFLRSNHEQTFAANAVVDAWRIRRSIW